MKYLPIPSETYAVMSCFRCSVMAMHTISYRILVTLQDANQHLSVSVVKTQSYEMVSRYQIFTYTQLVLLIWLLTSWVRGREYNKWTDSCLFVMNHNLMFSSPCHLNAKEHISLCNELHTLMYNFNEISISSKASHWDVIASQWRLTLWLNTSKGLSQK